MNVTLCDICGDRPTVPGPSFKRTLPMTKTKYTSEEEGAVCMVVFRPLPFDAGPCPQPKRADICKSCWRSLLASLYDIDQKNDT